MAQRVFREMIERKWSEGKRVCVGLDSDPGKIPEAIRKGVDGGIGRFNFEIIDATRDLVCAYKPNVAFYESLGVFGIIALKATMNYLQTVAPDVPVIGDVKRGDTYDTNVAHAKTAFEYFGFDAVTVNGYVGDEALRPFLDRKDKGIFVLCRTSNKGSDQFQDLNVLALGRQIPLYQYVAYQVATSFNQNNNCGLVVGATYPDELAHVRAIVGDDMPILITGVGAQGGDMGRSVKAAVRNMIINAGRSVIFASSGPDFAQAARKETIKLQEAIGRCSQ